MSMSKRKAKVIFLFQEKVTPENTEKPPLTSEMPVLVTNGECVVQWRIKGPTEQMAKFLRRGPGKHTLGFLDPTVSVTTLSCCDSSEAATDNTETESGCVQMQLHSQTLKFKFYILSHVVKYYSSGVFQPFWVGRPYKSRWGAEFSLWIRVCQALIYNLCWFTQQILKVRMGTRGRTQGKKVSARKCLQFLTRRCSLIGAGQNLHFSDVGISISALVKASRKEIQLSMFKFTEEDLGHHIFVLLCPPLL